MHRTTGLGVLVACGALSIAVHARQAGPLSQQALDATKIEKVRDNLFMITGSTFLRLGILDLSSGR